MAAELAEHEGGLAAQVVGHVDAVAHRDIGAAAAGRLAGGQRLAGFHRHRPPHGYRLAVQGGVAGGAGERHHGVAMEFQRRAHQRGLQAGGAGVVADNAVAEPEGVIVHGPGRRHADVPVAGAAGVVLHRGVGARFHHFEGGGGVLKGFQVAGGDLAFHHLGVDQNAAQIIQVGGDAGQARGGQGVLHFLQRRRPVIAVHDHLGEHRVVVRAHPGAGVHPAVQADVVRERHLGELAGAGLEILERVLGVDAYFHGVATAPVVRVQRRLFAAGQHHHPGHQVDAEHRLGDAVLHLKAGVHLQEIELVALVVVDVFHGAGGLVVHRLAQAHGAGVQLFPGGLGQAGGRGFLHHFLVAALQGAFALAQGQHLAVAVAEDLHFHMTGAGHEALDEDAAVGEKVFPHALHRFKGVHQLLFVIAAAQADAAAAGGALQHDGIADFGGGAFRFVQALQQAGARGQRHAGGFRQGARFVLEAEAAQLVRGRADKPDAGFRAGFGEVRVLGQKAVAGDDALGAGVLGGLQNQLAAQITLGGGLAAQRHRFVGGADVLAVTVRVGVHRHRGDAHFLERAADAYRDLPPVGDQNFAQPFFMHCSNLLCSASTPQGRLCRWRRR